MKAFLVTVACLAGFLGLIWILLGNGFFMYKVFAPKYADAQRNVFENSQSYVQGKADYLLSLQHDYEDATVGTPHRAGIRRMILEQAATVDNSKLPSDLRSFIGDLKAGQQ
jgi:hypothetical protein